MLKFTKTGGLAAIKIGVSLGALSLATLAGVSSAQDANSKKSTGDDTVVIVTGYRASLQKSLNQKRRSDIIEDVITAEDVGKFPESNLSEALQRLPGISIERDNGEGRTITVRGLGGDFVRTRMNGIETTATTGNNEGQTGINRSRGFDYNVFATDLFSRLSVLKSAEASMDEGSLGATVDIDTGRPLDRKGQHFAFSAQDAYYKNNGRSNPRFAGMYSNTFFGDKLGIMVSGAYNKVDNSIDFFDRNPGQFEYLYRSSDLAGPVQNGTGGAAKPTCDPSHATKNDATHNSSPLNCFWGFALPTSYLTSDPQSLGIASTSQMFGSDPAAYALVNGDPTKIIPALVSLEHQDLKSKRVGLTTAVQWRPDDKTDVKFDVLYAQFTYDNQSHIMGTFGLNRQFDNARAEIGLTNSSTGLRPYSGNGANYFADRYGAYSNKCKDSATQDCTGTLGVAGTPVFSTAQYWNGSAYMSTASQLGLNTWSTNPYNLNTYDYYNNPGSVGYDAMAAAADHRGILMYDQIVGKPHTTIQDAHVNSAGQVDYMQLNRMDWLSNDAYGQNDTIFKQYDLTVDHRFSDRLKMRVVYGTSYSHLRITGGRVDMFALDKDNYVFDARGGGDMPVINPGFNTADVSQWDDVKGYSGIAIYNSEANNSYDNLRADFIYNFDDHLTFEFGASRRIYGFNNSYQTNSFSQIPTIAEINKYGREQNNATDASLTLADLGHVVEFGQGLKVPAGTATSWWTPDRDKFESVLDFKCNCINAFGDWRVYDKIGSGLVMQEKDDGNYVQLDFNYDVFGRPLRGNAGVRVVTTHVTGTSQGTSSIFNGVTQTGTSQYTDTLPSLNMAYEPIHNVLVRFAVSKTMARPSLGNLAPGVTKLSISTTPVEGSPPTLALGNPGLKPFRATNVDFNVEWYFQKDALLSLALFHKELGNFPRTQTLVENLKDAGLPTDLYNSIHDNLNADQQAYMDSGSNDWNVTTFVNSPGGYINGVELQYQQDLNFLPKPFDGFGIQANLTHLESSLAYLTQAGVWAKAPWPFASPNAFNATIYYEKGKFQGRISYSWRDRFATVFPQASGTCSPGLTTNGGAPCNSPYNDFGGTDASKYVDAKFSYSVSKNIKAELSVQNVFDETQGYWNYVPSVVTDYKAGTGTIVTFGMRYSY